ncbi:MAG: aminoglycoside phosphotransferase family protein [Comamonas sp.]
MKTQLAKHLAYWSLAIDGQPIQTPAALLQPVIWQGQAAMLKISTASQEIEGYALLRWWGGDGAARVFEQSGSAILMERSAGSRSLAALSREENDDEACRIICAVVARLHSPRAAPMPALTPLNASFRALETSALGRHGVLRPSHQAMTDLLAQPQDVRCLHGDIHHHNILYFEERGWLAIDPKGLWGERAFDYANLFCNPEIEVAGNVERFLSRVGLVAEHAHLDRQRLLKWILAWAGLSAAWHFEDGTSADIALSVAKMADAALNSM